MEDTDRALAQSAAPVAGPGVGAGAQPDASSLLARGDRKGAIALLMDEHSEAVFAFCVRVLRDRVLAEDVLQQVYLEAHRDIGRFEGRSSFRTWLLRIASHRCHDAIRSRNRRAEVAEPDDEVDLADTTDTGTSPGERLEQSQLLGALEACLMELSDDVRMTVLLRFQSGMTYEEMSPVLGARVDALQARVSRALPVLRRCLERKGWHHV
jgi:RNA polymerase sigma-70 factor, ECF subfamily